MIRVMMVIFLFHPIVGGAERQAKKLAVKLRERGIAVSVAAGRLRGLKRFEYIDDIPVYRIFCLWGLKGLRRIGRYFYMLSLFFFLVSKRREYNIIHCPNTSHATFVCILAGKLLNKKVITKIGGGDCLDINLRSLFYFGSYMIKVIQKNVDKAIAIDGGTLKTLEKEGFLKNRIEKIPNGVDLPQMVNLQNIAKLKDKLGVNNYSNIVTCICRFRPEKGHEVLLKAWQEVLKRNSDSFLLLVGDGETLLERKQDTAMLGIAKKIKFTGKVFNVQDYLHVSNIFVLPSRREGLSNALLEAMATGLPCIASNVGGNVELISHEKNGLLFESGNSKQLARRILRLLDDKELAQRLGEKAQSTVSESFSIEHTANCYIQLYRSLVS